MTTTVLDKPKQTNVDWEAIRAQFDLDFSYTHLGTSQFLASHPKPLQAAIDRHRRELDRNPVVYILDHEQEYAQRARIAAAKFFGMNKPNDIALTDSTTMGLGTIYTGLNIKAGQEILTSEQNYYTQQEAIKRSTERTGATFREVTYYENIHEVTEEEMVHNLMKEVRDETRVIGATWVHSSTGLKSPIAKIAKALEKINQNRDEESRILLVVDGVHGFGIELETFDELGCDFFITGTHKWIYGPRGTGIIAAKTSAWQHVKPVIPSFSEVMYHIIAGGQQPEHVNGHHMSPGGFHSMEHQWAMPDAFEWVEGIGKENIYQRVHELNRMCKEGLAEMPHVTLYTPMDDRLSAGIVSFRVNGMTVKDTVKRLVEKKVIATEAPYKETYARFTPGIINTPEDVKRALDAVQSLK
ncbi:MAG TPA: aminotransferase class V-fold PLP-dependent enzyme [Candidatus Bathyarchaeia archaeon]|nr:aminotransferase class V-fold PLP-dependent enzyme [Candidatus Bathyarchaeia archaeon]